MHTTIIDKYLRQMNCVYIKIDSDDYFDVAESVNVLDGANDGSWDVTLGLQYVFIEGISCGDVLTFEIVDAKKYALAVIKHGFKGTPISYESQHGA